MSDNEIIEIIAEFWCDNGGDAEGFIYLTQRIKERIEAETLRRNQYPTVDTIEHR